MSFAIFKLEATCNCNMFRKTNHHNSTNSSKYAATATKMLQSRHKNIETIYPK